jgi:thioesterase domain-containing protein/acyl carrier protein
VKLRGHRIELGEIEAELVRQPGVTNAVVVLSTRRSDGGELVAYVEAASAPPAPAVLRTALAEHLPAYMLPSAFVVVDALPLSSNGKIDRRRLPDPDPGHTAGGAAGEHDAPRDLLEQTIAAIWQEVLQRDGVGRTDNFFDLGGHSLTAVRMFAEIERRCGVRLPLAAIFKGATIEALAMEVRAREGDDEPWRSLVLLKPGTSARPLFLFPMVGGEVFSWKDLVAHLAPEQVVYGLQSLGLDGRQWSHRTLPDMAAHFIDEMRTVQAHGPYLLVGFCFGGAVALEVAHQLGEAGEEIALLAMVDVSRHVADAKLTGFQNSRRKWAKFRSQGKGGAVAWVIHRANNARIKTIKAVWWRVYDMAERHDRHLPRRLHKVRWVNQRAIHQWTAPPSPTRVVMFRRASLHREDSFYQGAVRSKLSDSGLDERIIGTDDIEHADMIREPAVRELAAAMTTVIAEVTERLADAGPTPATSASAAPAAAAATTTRLEAT